MNPSKKWKVKDIQQWIREQTEKANEIVKKVFGGELTNPKYTEEIRKMQKATGQKRTGVKNPISLMFRGKTKSQLLSQARKLRNFFKADEEIRVEERKKEGIHRAYNTFKERFGEDISEDTFNKMREVFGGLNLAGWNIESDYVAGNIIDNLENGYTVQEITMAWKRVLEMDMRERAMNAYEMIKEVDAFLRNLNADE